MGRVEQNRRDRLLVDFGIRYSMRRDHDLPPGEIIDTWNSIRTDVPLPPRNDGLTWESHDVVIVGAGVAGLAAAWRFQHADFDDVVVLEVEQVAGGTSRSAKSYPWGAHYISAPLRGDRLLTRVLSEMNVLEGTDSDGNPVVAKRFIVRPPEQRVFYRGNWYEGCYLRFGATLDDLRQFREFESEIAKWVAFRDGRGRRAFAIPTVMASDDAEVMALDRISMAQWMDAHHWLSPRLRWYVDFACRDDYGMRLSDTSAWAGVFYFASRIAAPQQESQPSITWREGNGRLVAHLGKSARVDTERLVTSVTPSERGVDVIAISRDGRHIRGIHAGHVVFAAPQFVAAMTIPGYRDVYQFTYGSWLVANVTLNNPPKSEGYPLAWDNVLYDSPSLGYVVSTHQSAKDGDPIILTYYYPICDHEPHVAQSRLMSLDRDECAEVILSDLESAHPEIQSLTRRLDVMRWGRAMIRPQPGFINSAARRHASEPWRKVHFANTDLSAVALFEEALYHGVRAAEEVLRENGREIVSFA